CNKKIAVGKTAVPNTDNELTPETACLLKNLMSIPEKGFLFGHHDDPLYGVGWKGDNDRSDIKSITGDYPAVMSFDLGRIELEQQSNIDKTNFDKI
ncbi:MAG TPA: beta-mannosidase, partial [Paludibacteraceae bacterium]|nr:beta-mannosidase [Paludibacteraceae bacterium]